MSLTLRDAQHLSWKTFKKFEAVDQKNAANIGTVEALATKVADLAQMTKADVASEIGNPKGNEAARKVFSEIVFNVLVLAERSGVELEDSFLQTIDEIILGFVS